MAWPRSIRKAPGRFRRRRSVLFCDRGDDLVERRVGESAHLVVGAVLDGVRARRPRAGSTPSAPTALSAASTNSVDATNTAGDAPPLQIDDVVHTARRARPSVGERLDDDVALLAIS